MDLAVFAAAYALFHFTHGIADYWLQTDHQAQGKSKTPAVDFWALAWNAHDLWIRLKTGQDMTSLVKPPIFNTWIWKHVAVYTFCFAFPIYFLACFHSISAWKFWGLLVSIGLPHLWMDQRRFLSWFCHKTKGWNPGDLDWAYKGAGVTIPESHFYKAAVRVHVTIHMDQKFHYACLGLTALWLAC